MLDEFIKKAWDIQNALEKRVKRIGKGKYGRVFKMARHPEPEEYTRTAEICGIGIS
jgi:preprotein translocase subunit Sss1